MPRILPPAERRSVVLVTTYAALSLLLLIIGDHLPASGLRAVGSVVFAPFDRIVLTGDRLFSAWNENQALHQRLATLELDNVRLRTQADENRTLRAQLDLPEWKGLQLRPVEVLAFGGDPSPTSAVLSAGEREGVHVGDAVLTSDGLVGRILEIYPHLSRAALLTDPNVAVACEVESTGVHGMLHFALTPRPRLLLTTVPLTDTIRVGQIVVTSDLSLRFPRGIPVGRVTRVTSDAGGLMQAVEVTPAARLTRLRHAFITPGPVVPDGALPRPKLEFEPRRVAVPLGVKGARAAAVRDSLARIAAKSAPRPAAKPAADSTGGVR